ncbi:uncharacterized protein LOC142524835 isoform X3 [Primulina tabacum]|uniref:uncharacterized protein LOC142524835 isoform X3 n=1 Tax=Primulina tabacum TaxID=48773 RepID=UPI003F5A76BC
MEGCIVGLMAWVYERVPMLGEPRVLHCFPRLFKWVESKIPVNPIGAEAALMAVRSNKIVPIKPFEEEKKLVDDTERIVEVQSRYNDSELLEHIKRLENEIKVLKEKNEVVEDDTTQFVFKDATHMYDEGHTEQDVDGHVDAAVEILNEVVENKVKTNTEDNVKVESYVRVFVDEVEMNTNSGDNVHVGTDIGEGKEMIIFNPKSSIVKTVQKRTDRLKKRKHPDYLTPPSMTPKRKRKQESSLVLNLDDIDVKGIAESAVEESLQEFRGRRDYDGHDQISKEERDIIENGVVWQDDDVILHGHELLLCLFGSELRSDLIHAYFNTLSNRKHKYGHDIYCMSPNVQINVIRMLEKMKQKRVKDKDFSEFTSQLDGSTLSKLSELNKEVLERCKHIIFPISYRAHWILLGYTRGDQYFTLRDSLSGPVYKGAAKKIAKFMSGYLWNVKNCDVGKGEVIALKCRQQGNDLNCGVYVCLWDECFARDNPTFWNEE